MGAGDLLARPGRHEDGCQISGIAAIMRNVTIRFEEGRALRRRQISIARQSPFCTVLTSKIGVGHPGRKHDGRVVGNICFQAIAKLDCTAEMKARC
jgi:hypothetical protein